MTVHGWARTRDLRGADADFAALTREHYGTGWDEWEGPPVAWAIEADRMLAADMSARATASGSHERATADDRDATGVRS